MRVDKVMMIGVGLLGAFAAYKLVTSKQAEEKPRPEPGILPGLGTPDRANGTGLILLGDPLKLTNKQYYQARLSLGSAFPFSKGVTEEMLGQALGQMGFADIRVFMNLKELPSGFPASQTVNAGESTRWFQGMWQAPSMELPRPSNVEAMWPIERPSTAVAGIRMGQVPGFFGA